MMVDKGQDEDGGASKHAGEKSDEDPGGAADADAAATTALRKEVGDCDCEEISDEETGKSSASVATWVLCFDDAFLLFFDREPG